MNLAFEAHYHSLALIMACCSHLECKSDSFDVSMPPDCQWLINVEYNTCQLYFQQKWFLFVMCNKDDANTAI